MQLRQRKFTAATASPSKPILAINTQVPVKPEASVANQHPSSAPVGTRQERGIPPTYQATDRYCEKLAELMNSPTWRTENPGPHIANLPVPQSPNVGYGNTQSPLPPNYEDTVSKNQRQEDSGRVINGSPQNAPSPPGCGTVADEIQLGHDIEAIRILSIHPFLEMPEAPNNTYIISAAVSSKFSQSQEGLSGQMQRVGVTKKRDDVLRRTTEDSGIPIGGSQDDGQWNDSKKDPQISPRPVCSPDNVCKIRNEESQKAENCARQLMERDEAIESINNSFRSPRRCGQTAPNEKQRFEGLLERLHGQYPLQDSYECPDLVDPAIISFGPKRNVLDTPTKRSRRHRSDSGYASPSVYSRPSTRAQSRVDCGSFENLGPAATCIQHQEGESNYFAPESPTKNQTLNPAAKEFSSTSDKNLPPGKGIGLVRPSIPSNLWLPPKETGEILSPISPLRFDTAFHTPPETWFPSLANINNRIPIPSGPLNSFPDTLPPIGGFSGTAGSYLPDLGITGPAHPPAPFPWLSSGLSPLSGNGPVPGIIPPSTNGPFHQQLPSLAACNNPAHQVMIPFSLPELAPAAPPSLIPQRLPEQFPMQMTPQSSFGGLSIHKNVRKPKVPNTKGQQNWELMHELRRMHEPGYAQRCKEKQKKRYMKQLEKSGCMGTES